jgi:enoyl-CoA hydratase
MGRSAYSDVLFRVAHGIGWVTLNRPKALNALDHQMVRRIDAQLAGWADDDAVGGVALTGAGERGLCAGGDIRSIYADARAGGRASLEFLRDEYLLNARIAGYPKPYLAVMDGLVMGGGVGISAHGSIRVVTDRTAIALPEVSIGFVPDTGGTWLLSRAPGELGTHLALTADRFGAGDAIGCGFADYYLPASQLPVLLGILRAGALQAGALQAGALRGGHIEPLVASLAEAAPASGLAAMRPWIDACYSAGTAGQIVARLQGCPDPAAQRAARQILGNSPTAVTVALRALRRARQLATLREELDQELRISAAALDSADLVEGIRAQVIDKDRQPSWSPATLAEVTSDMVDRYFTPVPLESARTGEEGGHAAGAALA